MLQGSIFIFKKAKKSAFFRVMNKFCNKFFGFTFGSVHPKKLKISVHRTGTSLKKLASLFILTKNAFFAKPDPESCFPGWSSIRLIIIENEKKQETSSRGFWQILMSLTQKTAKNFSHCLLE